LIYDLDAYEILYSVISLLESLTIALHIERFDGLLELVFIIRMASMTFKVKFSIFFNNLYNIF
jgi:hypothetical protein